MLAQLVALYFLRSDTQNKSIERLELSSLLDSVDHIFDSLPRIFSVIKGCNKEKRKFSNGENVTQQGLSCLSVL